jgi:hypothetical protein
VSDATMAVLGGRGRLHLRSLQRTVSFQTAGLAADLLEGRKTTVTGHLRMLLAGLFERANSVDDPSRLLGLHRAHALLVIEVTLTPSQPPARSSCEGSRRCRRRCQGGHQATLLHRRAEPGPAHTCHTSSSPARTASTPAKN